MRFCPGVDDLQKEFFSLITRSNLSDDEHDLMEARFREYIYTDRLFTGAVMLLALRDILGRREAIKEDKQGVSKDE